ncbi:MAG: hypothetical protein MI824_09455 [Hyphomicrobiales bacterium]|nr:hypothetical protein [Hyphomicrobiales bacterium]
MTTPAPPPARGGDARADRAIDALASGNQRWQRLKEIFPSLKKFLLILGLGLLSWFSTYTGMLELIQANTGPVDFLYRFFIGIAVALLMLMIIYILDTLFSPVSWWLRSLYILGYVFLTLISVGFGFGFYWKFLESRSEATRSAEAAISHVQGSLQTGQTRLEQLQSTLDTLTALSRQKAQDEREKGNTCPNSRPGDGPRRRLRDADAQSFQFVSDFMQRKIGTVRKDLDGLSADFAKVLSNDSSTVDPRSGTRNTFLRGVNRKLDLTVTRFNTLRTDPQLVEHRNSLAARAERTVFPGGRGGTFSCPDPQLQSALRGVVRAIDGLPEIKKPEIAAVEGSEAIVEAFRRLTTTTIGAFSLKLPPSPDELRDLQKKAVQSALRSNQAEPAILRQEPGLGQRDYIPLFIALFVDLCILLVSINRPINRFQMLVTLVREARDGPVSQILQRFHDTHLAGLQKEFEVFQHVVFDFMGDYYVAVPLSAKRADAHYLANLFVSLEGQGIVDRVILPPAFIVRRKLEKQGSAFAGERVFRLYRFRNGAWSKLVLDAILGGERERRAEAEKTADGRNPNGGATPAGRTNGHEPGMPAPEQAPVLHRPEEDVIALPGPETNGGGRARPKS